MTDENHWYKNAIIERVNGILKDAFYVDQTLTSVVHAKKASKMQSNDTTLKDYIYL